MFCLEVKFCRISLNFPNSLEWLPNLADFFGGDDKQSQAAENANESNWENPSPTERVTKNQILGCAVARNDHLGLASPN